MISRRKIQIVLGILWLLDGALQLQHQMFTSNFANDVIAPAAQGQPVFVSGPMHFAIHIFLMHPAVFNTFIALIQLGIGVLILWKRTVKYGLLGSILWGLFVWYIGEGLSGLAIGQASLLMGAPGAALLYSIISLGVMPPKSAAREANRPAYWLAFMWAILWLGGAVLQLVNGQNTSSELATMVAGMADGAPGWMAAINLHLADFLRNTGNWIVALLVLVQALVGFCVLLKRRMRASAVAVGILLSLVFWLVGQSLGTYYSGLATDPSTAPLIILLGLAILGSKEVELGIL